MVAAGPAAAETTRVALVPIRNAGGDPRADYLAGIIEGLLLFDLSSQEDISLVERANLEAVIAEQRLSLSGLTEGTGDAQRIGELLEADYLLTGDYVFLGDEVLINARLVDVATAEARAVSERGRTENAIHRVAEKLIAGLTGARVSLVDPAAERSILSMKDERPGTVVLRSPLVDAEIALDGQFVGYTTGDITEPIVIEDVSPGPHVIQTYLGRRFGVVKTPEFTFGPWREEVLVRPGRRTVVRDASRDFNSVIYEHMWLLYDDASLAPGDEVFELDQTLSFVNRESRRVPIDLSLRAEPRDAVLSVSATLRYAGRPYTYELVASKDEAFEVTEEIGIVELELEGVWRSGNWELDYSLRRTDLEQGMFRR